MAMELLVRVRGVADASSFNAAFRSLGAASAAANRQVEAAAARSGRATQSIYRESARAAVQAADAAASAAEKSAAAEVRSKERALARVAAIRERYFREEQRRGEQAERAAERSAQRQERASAAAAQRQVQMLSGAARTFGSLARTGLSTLGSVAMGMGIDTSLAGGLGRGMALESAAVAIANKGNRGGAAEDPKKLEALARNVGDQFKVDPTKVLAGLDKFQSLTGDLNLGKIALKDLVGLSKAFKIDVDQLVGSAANVATKIGDVGDKFKTPEEKAKAVLDVMKSLVAQGQEGAIEMPDLVTQLSALGAAAPRFEGSAAANISKMGAMAQLALQMGGAKSASQATTAVMGFANTLSTPARRAQFKAMGVDIDSTSEKGKFLDPFEIIKKSLQATGGDTDKMKKLFANVVGERAVRALTNSYLGAGGGQAGLAAVDKQFARFGGTVNDKQIQDNLGRELGTKASEAQAFQNELDKITSAMGTELAPAMKELAPVALSAAKSLAGIVTFGAQNPGLMITGALVASIGKAAVGEAVGKAVGGMLANMTASNVGLGLLAAAAVAAAAAIIDYQAKSDAEKGKGDKDASLVAKAEKELRETGKISKDTIDEIATRRAEVSGMQGALKTGGVDYQGGTAAMVSKFMGGGDQIAVGEGATVNAKEMGAEKLDALAGKLDALIAAYGKTQRVYVENAADMKGPAPGPTVNTAAQSGGVH